MSQNRHNQRGSMMPAPPNPTPDHDVQTVGPKPTGPMRIAYVMDRMGGSWRLRICEIPESVVNQHTVVAHEPDVYAITSSRMHSHLDARVLGGES